MLRMILVSAVVVLSASAADAQVRVNGYTRSDGTYVAPYTRSSPGTSSYSAPRPVYGSSATTACTGYGCYGQPSTTTGSPRTTTVNGYVRRDGTYVAAYVRSSPRY